MTSARARMRPTQTGASPIRMFDFLAARAVMAARRATAALALLATLAAPLHAQAQSPPQSAPPPASQPPAATTPSASTPAASAGATSPGLPPPPPIETARGVAYLSANLAGQTQPVRQGLVWRVYRERAEDDGSRPLVAESRDAAPALSLPDGIYVVHVSYGLASALKRVTIAGAPVTERFILNAGALRVRAVLGDNDIPRQRVSISVFVPDRGNSEAKLVVQGAQPGEIIRLPEGGYHVVSTYLDAIAPSTQAAKTGEGSPERLVTNSVVTADLRVPSGKLIDATLKHRAATITLKLVNAVGGEALPNTVFTVLTPGGDVIRELRGAFPSLVLAEGEYVVIARNDEKTFQTTFRVTPALDRDVEIVAK